MSLPAAAIHRDTLRTLRALRERPAWQLLAAPDAPLSLAVLQAAFGGTEQALPLSTVMERAGDALAALVDGEAGPAHSAADWVNEALRQGWLVRGAPGPRSASGADSEQAVALGSAALAALRFAAQLLASATPEAVPADAPLATPSAPPHPASAGQPSPLAQRARAPASVPASDMHEGASQPTPRQLDIFADSDDVRRRNDFAAALQAGDPAAASASLQAWRQAQPDDALLHDAQVLLDRLSSDAAAAGEPAVAAAAVLASRALLEQAVDRAARSLLGSEAPRWLASRWRLLAERARPLAWQPAAAAAHAAGLWLQAGDDAAAAAAVAAIESWRRIPQPLLWMAEARWRAADADAAWPLLAEAFWLAPARAHALLQRLADRRLKQAMQRFEEDFDLDVDCDAADAAHADWAWWPAWLVVEQPLLAGVLALADEPPGRAAAEGCRLVLTLLRLEREGRHHDIVAARKRLQALEPRLFKVYMRTR